MHHFAMATCLILWASLAYSQTPDWSEGTPVPEQGRPNPYSLPTQDLPHTIQAGQMHALVYPVEPTGIHVPYRPFKQLADGQNRNLLRRAFQGIFRRGTRIESFDDFLEKLGLLHFPHPKDKGIYSVPRPKTLKGHNRMGFTLVSVQGEGEGFTFSCAACHAGNLFGKKVLGLTNRFPQANEVFFGAKRALSLSPAFLFGATTGATRGERRMFKRMKKNIASSGVKRPLVLGLDTSLAQVSLSLARRSQDAYATKSSWYERFPRKDLLDRQPADSKPSVWWNLKFKNRWLSDGSIVSGNPIFTNFLWNEIGRGSDLKELQLWLEQNPEIIKELTTAVFSSQAPPITDFFEAKRIKIQSAQRGEMLFNQTCAGCHGTYSKAWSQADAHTLPLVEQLKTIAVDYPEQTPIYSVGTDPLRALGMKPLAQGLNPLKISQANQIVIKPQQGYVPPPLVGIWARWPYFHNNSAPNLCAVLTASDQRPRTYAAGEALDRDKDYDWDCVGYPTGAKTPSHWKTKYAEAFYDTRRPGMNNIGHDEGIFLKDGKELLSPQDKRDIIEFLKTL